MASEATERTSNRRPPCLRHGHVHHKNILVAGSLCRSPTDNDEVEWQGDRVYLHLGARRDDPPRGQSARPLPLSGVGRWASQASTR
jgi:hypothetical protein